MSIVIETELFLKNCEPYRRILRVKALEASQLPEEYLKKEYNTFTCMYSADGETQMLEIWDAKKHRWWYLKEGDDCKEEEFTYILDRVKEAGENLRRIKEKNKKEWEDKLGRYIYYI